MYFLVKVPADGLAATLPTSVMVPLMKSAESRQSCFLAATNWQRTSHSVRQQASKFCCR